MNKVTMLQNNFSTIDCLSLQHEEIGITGVGDPVMLLLPLKW